MHATFKNETVAQVARLQHSHCVDVFGFLLLLVAGAGHGDRSVAELGAAAPPAAFGGAVPGLATGLACLIHGTLMLQTGFRSHSNLGGCEIESGVFLEEHFF